MIMTQPRSIAAIFVCIWMLVAVPVRAQSSLGPVELDAINLHHRMMYQMTKDMTDEMSRMTEQMARGDLTLGQRKQMADRMRRMSMIMRRLAGLEARPWLKHADFQKQIDAMRTQMDQMMGDSKMRLESK